MLEASVLTAASAACGAVVGGAVSLVEVEELRPGRVGRCTVSPAVGGASTVVVKAAEPGTAAARGLATVHNEHAALALLDRVAPGAAPRLLAAVPDAGILVLEDLGEGPSLATRLLGDDADAARDAVVATAVSLGRLQVRTMGHADAFAEHRRRLGPIDVDREPFMLRGLDMRHVMGVLPDLLRTHDLPGLPHGHPAVDDLQDVLDELADPGPFLAFSTGDPCPDNSRLTDAGVRLFDFEAAAFRHALIDGAHFRVPFPNCWCWRRLPDEVAAAAQAAYRQELAAACPDAADLTRFAESFGRTCTAWAAWTLHRRLPQAPTDRHERRRIAETVTNLRAVASEAPRLTATVAWADALHQSLTRRWPADTGSADTYPAFGGPPWTTP